MRVRCLLAACAFACAIPHLAAEDEKPLTPVAARKKVGTKITVEMEVKAAKDRLDKRGEIYLDADTDFKGAENFAVVITRKGAASLKKAGIAAAAEHFRGKTIRATGTVKEVGKIPRIEIDEAKQIQALEKASGACQRPGLR